MGNKIHKSYHSGTDGVNCDYIGKSGTEHDHEGTKYWDHADSGERLKKDSDGDWVRPNGSKYRQGGDR